MYNQFKNNNEIKYSYSDRVWIPIMICEWNADTSENKSFIEFRFQFYYGQMTL